MFRLLKKCYIIIIFAIVISNVQSVHVYASAYDSFKYKKGVKLYKKSNIIKGKKHLTKYTRKGSYHATNYQIVKMSKGKITLRPQKGWWGSEDPYFKNKKISYKLSSKCKFYYRDAGYPYYSDSARYKRVTKKAVLNYMKDKDFKDSYDYVDEAGGMYYIGGYFGDMYIKNGKVVAVLTDGGV